MGAPCRGRATPAGGLESTPGAGDCLLRPLSSDAAPEMNAVMGRDTGSVSGTTRSQSHDRPPRRFQPGRVSAYPACGTRLSIYNEDIYCTLHVKSNLRIRGKKAV